MKHSLGLVRLWWARSSVGRALALQARGRRFEACRVHILLYIFLLVILCVFLFRTTPERAYGDFDIYYAASQNFLDLKPIYIFHGGSEEFKYSPLFAFLFSPLTWLLKTVALYVWNGLCGIFFILTLYLLFSIKNLSLKEVQWKEFLLMLLLTAFVARYLIYHIKIGQVNILIGFLLMLMTYCFLKKRHDFLVAMPLAASLMIKLFPLLFVAYFFLRGRFKIVFYALLCIGGFLLLPLLYTGIDQCFQYTREWVQLLRQTPATMIYSPKNNSLLSFYSWLFIVRHEPYAIFEYFDIKTTISLTTYLSWIGTCLGLFSVWFLNKRRLDIDMAGLFILAVIFNPLAYKELFYLQIVPYFFALYFIFYEKVSKVWKYLVSFGVGISFLVSNSIKSAYLPDAILWKFLEYRPLLWGALLLFLSLLFIKFLDDKFA